MKLQYCMYVYDLSQLEPNSSIRKKETQSNINFYGQNIFIVDITWLTDSINKWAVCTVSAF